MCVIIIKPKGVDLPDYATFSSCWVANNDGFGMCFSDGNSVTIDKGYMHIDEAWLAMSKLSKDHAAILHFRISTSGLVDSGACHPYPVTSDAGKLRALRLTNLPYAVAHNGIIGKGGVTLNDTQLWVQNELSLQPLTMRKHMQTYLNDWAKTAHSRFVILYGDGSFIKAGQWTKQDGLFFSNMHWDYGYGYGSTMPKVSFGALENNDEWDDWGYSYYDAVDEGYTPVCPVCGSYNTLAHYDSPHNLCECNVCGAVFNGVSKDVYIVDRHIACSVNRHIKKAAFYGY